MWVPIYKDNHMLRAKYLKQIQTQFRVHTVCGLLGPRQVGKTTLARAFAQEYFPNNSRFFDLENPIDLALLENPLLALSNIPQKLVVIDEIQLRPDLFPILRVLVDNPKIDNIYLILGSASRDLIRQSSETLAGRIGYIELFPFSLLEVHNSAQLWLRGGFPRSYLAETDDDSYLWRQNYITTFLERDIPSFGFNIPPARLRRFWLMLAHYHGQIFNASEIGKSLGVSNHTAQSYLDILTGTFMVLSLPPWFENLSKRQVKASKIYFRDSGILHALTGIRIAEEAQTNPKLGAYWEGFALEEIIRTLQAQQGEYYFWSTQSQAEIDLLIIRNGKRIGFEFKYTDKPKTTKSMHIALEDLKLDQIALMYPGDTIFPLHEKIVAYGLETIATGAFLQQLPQI
jgi:predicted AAA+ superfamily ATPase